MMKQLIWIVFGWFTLLASAQAQYTLGAKHHVQNDLLDFYAIQLFFDGRLAGWIGADTLPVSFSNRFYAYAKCHTSRETQKPDDYCTDWHLYDKDKKSHGPLSLPGLREISVPSFSWPYVAYVMVPTKITTEDFKRTVVDVSCVVVEWPSKRVVARQKAMVNVGYFEGDTPGEFIAPKFVQSNDVHRVTCSAEGGAVIATAVISK